MNAHFHLCITFMRKFMLSWHFEYILWLFLLRKHESHPSTHRQSPHYQFNYYSTYINIQYIWYSFNYIYNCQLGAMNVKTKKSGTLLLCLPMVLIYLIFLHNILLNIYYFYSMLFCLAYFSQILKICLVFHLAWISSRIILILAIHLDHVFYYLSTYHMLVYFHLISLYSL